MPKATFFNISSTKRHRVITAAIQEFKNNSLKDASLNRIVKNAEIPKGSFYQYFENLDDLYHFVFEEVYQNEMRVVKKAIGEETDLLSIGELIILTYYPLVTDSNHMFYHSIIHTNGIFYEDLFLKGLLEDSTSQLNRHKNKALIELVTAIIFHVLSAAITRNYSLNETLGLYFDLTKLLKGGKKK